MGLLRVERCYLLHPWGGPRPKRKLRDHELEVLSLREVASFGDHVCTHFPKNLWRTACRGANAIRKQCRQGSGRKHLRKGFGAHV
eukprot:12406659-Alexandrium_andersonii.AAC.1